MRVTLITLIFLSTISLPCSGCSDDEPEKNRHEAMPLVSCSELNAEVRPKFLDARVSLHLEATSLAIAVDRLNNELGFPISFISADEALVPRLEVTQVSVHRLLDLMLADSRDYQCVIVHGHAMVAAMDKSSLRHVVKDVRIRNLPRSQAAKMYVERLSDELETLRDLRIFFGGVVESPVFTETVTLSPEATVIEHLAEILGDSDKVFIRVQRATTGVPYLTLGSVR